MYYVVSFAEGQAVATAAAVTLRGKVPAFASNFGRAGSENASRGWISGALAVPAAGIQYKIQFHFPFRLFFFSMFQFVLIPVSVVYLFPYLSFLQCSRLLRGQLFCCRFLNLFFTWKTKTRHICVIFYNNYPNS